MVNRPAPENPRAIGAALMRLLDSGDTAAPGDLAELTPAALAALDALAAEHRLQPAFHRLHGSDARIPAALRESWRSAARAGAIGALFQRRELLAAVALLRQHGIEPLILKGGWLAWHVYPEAAMRPLRDFDLLLREDDFILAIDLLLASGYTYAWPLDMPIAEIVRIDKSPPPLLTAAGTAFEPHLRAWFPAGRFDYPSPAPDTAAMFARAVVEGDGLLYPAPADMLAHLIIHAVYSHRLDCGPLLLLDIDYLVRARAIDWPALWTRAHDEGWASAAALVLAMTRDYRGSPIPPLAPREAALLPARYAELTAALMLQDHVSRLSAGFAAAAATGGWRGMIGRLRGETRVAGLAPVKRETGRGGYLGWALSRVWRTGSALLRRDVRRQARELAEFNRWLMHGGSDLRG